MRPGTRVRSEYNAKARNVSPPIAVDATYTGVTEARYAEDPIEAGHRLADQRRSAGGYGRQQLAIEFMSELPNIGARRLLQYR